MIPEFLFHYTKREIALEKILFDKKIKIGQVGRTNDPKESEPWPLFIMDNTFSQGPLDNADVLINKIKREAELIQKEEWKVLCLTKHSKKRARTKGGFHRLLEGYARPRMWAQYAENHSGVCLIFDGKKLGENIKNELKNKYSKNECTIRHGSVSYKNYGTSVISIDLVNKYGTEYALREYLFEHYKDVFLTKYLDWENESEYRWLVHSKTRSPEFVSIEGAIISVLVGMEFPKVYEPTLVKLGEKLNVTVDRIRWQSGIPIIDHIYPSE